MYKIRNVKFKDHPILKNLELNFCGQDGKAVDTIIIAGENGTGKSTVLDYLYNVMNGTVKYESTMEVESPTGIVTWAFYNKLINNKNIIWVETNTGIDALPGHYGFTQEFNINAIFSDVDINFHANDLRSVTSSTLDATAETRRSNSDLPTQIKQLLIDIQTMDDGDVSRICINNPSKSFNELHIDRRMIRFTNAFNKMFETLTYDRIENKNGYKNVVFKKGGVDISIDDLSSGEKQIVYRGCFLLKDVNAMNGAFVFIDEPEISLHPIWQMKIMDYYKGIFTNEDGVQTSQIFAVTHSPFIIHNDNRKNDKVLILCRDDNGEIIVKDKPEYYKCNCIEAVEDAFSIKNFSEDKSVVYLEGRTDEKYFKKAAEVFGYKDLPFEFQWVGHMKNEKDEENTGKDALNKAAKFLKGRNLSVKNVCLFDCDTGRKNSVENNVHIRAIQEYSNSRGMKKGIENALILDSIDIKPYYTCKDKEGDYGEKITTCVFEKMKMCDYICSLEHEQLKIVMSNLKKEIDALIDIFK